MNITEAKSVVSTLYRTILGRNADPSGLAHFSAKILAKSTPQDIANALLESEEYQARRIENPHPLSRFRDKYTDSDISYFMHRGQFRPLTISIETVNICNNNCVICPYSSQTRVRRIMPDDLFSKVVRDYIEIGGGPISLTPLVGEVFLDKRLPARLALLKSSPSIATISTTTNAVMVHRFSDAHLRSVLAGFDRIKISVYGLDPEEYRLMTRKDEYQKAIEGNLTDIAVCSPRIGCVRNSQPPPENP